MPEGCIWGGGFILDPVGSCIWEKIPARTGTRGHAPQSGAWVCLLRNHGAIEGIHLGKGHLSHHASFLSETFTVLGQDSAGAASSRKPSWISPAIPTTQGPVFCTTHSSVWNYPAMCHHTQDWTCQWQDGVFSSPALPLEAQFLAHHACMHWRRKWQPTPVLLPGESQGQGSLVGCHLWGHTESDMTEVT